MESEEIKEELKKMERWYESHGYAEETIKSYQKTLQKIFNWHKSNHKKEITQRTLNQYNKYLHKQPIKAKTIRNIHNIIRHYDKYQQKTQNKKLQTRPLEINQTDLASEKIILSQKEIKKLYQAIEESIQGYRDRAMLSLYYGCGLRKQEGLKLEEQDINHQTNQIHIKAGKTHRNRYLPMSSQVKKDIKAYQKESRPYLINTKTNKLLLNNQGESMKKDNPNRILKSLIQKANIEKPITLHSLRHSLATHLHQSGMPIEQISQYLGHRSLQSTQIYTHVLNKTT